MALRNGADEEEGECDAEQHQSVLHFSARFSCEKALARAAGDAMRRERIRGNMATETGEETHGARRRSTTSESQRWPTPLAPRGITSHPRTPPARTPRRAPPSSRSILSQARRNTGAGVSGSCTCRFADGAHCALAAPCAAALRQSHRRYARWFLPRPHANRPQQSRLAS